MSAWSEWRDGLISDNEYESIMRREDADDRYYDDTPFYTDDPDDPHWRCENCGHCKRVKLLKPVIGFQDWLDDNGYLHNNPKKPRVENLYARWSIEGEYREGNICELTNTQVYDDEYCEEFEEIV